MNTTTTTNMNNNVGIVKTTRNVVADALVESYRDLATQELKQCSANLAYKCAQATWFDNKVSINDDEMEAIADSLFLDPSDEFVVNTVDRIKTALYQTIRDFGDEVSDVEVDVLAVDEYQSLPAIFDYIGGNILDVYLHRTIKHAIDMLDLMCQVGIKGMLEKASLSRLSTHTDKLAFSRYLADAWYTELTGSIGYSLDSRVAFVSELSEDEIKAHLAKVFMHRLKRVTV